MRSAVLRAKSAKKRPNKTRAVPGERGGKGDLLFLFAVVLLSAFGVVAVYSASYYNAEVQYGDSLYFFRKQLIGFVLGLGAMVGISFVPYEKFRKAGIPALIVSLILLALVFIPGVGRTNYGATRWIGLGPITIQPSEFAKYGFVLFTAGYFAKNPARMRTFKGILPVLGAGIAVCILIMLEPNMSVTMCVGAIMIGMIFLGGASYKSLASICVPALLLVPVLIAAEPYRLQRLSAFVNPWASPKEEGYQLIQSLYALGNGKFFGVGLFRSRQKYRFLPFSESDFILSVIAEETGFFGVLILFAVIGFIVYRGFRIANSCNNFFGYLLVSGIVLAFAVQSALNALVVSGCIPPTGLPLPLISAGNTSLVVTMSGMGIVYGVSRHNQPQKFIRYSK